MRCGVLERAITPELRDAANALRAAGDKYDTTAAALKDELAVRLNEDSGFSEYLRGYGCLDERADELMLDLHEDPGFFEYVRSYASSDEDADLRATLANWRAAHSAHRSACHAFLRAIGHMT